MLQILSQYRKYYRSIRTQRLLLTCFLILLPAMQTDAQDDPWPFWGRTTTRISNTTTIGPRTPNIIWSIEYDPDPSADTLNRSSVVMDAQRRLFLAGQAQAGVIAIDSQKRKVLWQFLTSRTVSKTPAVWNGYVLFGETELDFPFYCVDADNGQLIWSFTTPLGFNVSPVVDPNGVAYFQDRGGTMFARRVADGSEVWTTDLIRANGSPALQWPNLLVGEQNELNIAGLDPLTGQLKWTFPVFLLLVGMPVITNSQVLDGSWDHNLYALDPDTGKMNWLFQGESSNDGAVAVGHDGTIYTVTSGGFGRLYAISPVDGKELWRWIAPGGEMFSAPIVDGRGTIYLTSGAGDRRGWVIAINPDGTELWTKQMPDECNGSPMLAPDGTLYIVCRDRYLYAFRDNAKPLLQFLDALKPGGNNFKIKIEDITPGGQVAILMAPAEGKFTVPTTNQICPGVSLELAEKGMRFVDVITANQNGIAIIEGDEISRNRYTGWYLQAVDLQTCEASNTDTIF